DCMRQNSLFKLEDVKAVVGFDDRAHVAWTQLLNCFFENLRELALVISREAAGVGVGRVRTELCGRGEVAPAFGHLAAQTVGFFARLNSNLADQEARAIGEPR